MYRYWSKDELQGAIDAMQNILSNPMQENPTLVSMELKEPLPAPFKPHRNPPVKLSWWERWKYRKKRKQLETLWKDAQFRFRTDCPLVISGQCTELQAVVNVSSWDIDGYGNLSYNIISRGLDGKLTAFGTSTYGVTHGPYPDVRPKYILITD
jgi:hypothetical protein